MSKNISLDEIKEFWPDKAPDINIVQKYIKKYENEKIVIKYGGNVLIDRNVFNNFISDINVLNRLGLAVVVVHGGGVQISETLKKEKLDSKFINGSRVTDEKTLKIVEKVLIKRINNKIVNLINQAGGKAISLPGHKRNLIEVKPLKKKMGFVGEPRKIKTKIIKNLIKKNYIPIIASLGFKEKKIFNINADTVAGALASSLSATRFYFITNIKGVMDKNN